MLEKRDVRATGPRNEIDFSNKRELVVVAIVSLFVAA